MEIVALSVPHNLNKLFLGLPITSWCPWMLRLGFTGEEKRSDDGDDGASGSSGDEMR